MDRTRKLESEKKDQMITIGNPMHLYLIISECWRRCIGIEPIYDSVSAARAGLKSGAPTSDASISVQMT